MSSHTLEGKKKTQNGVKRLMFTVLSILLEVVFLVGIFKGLNEYAVVIDNMTRIFAVILVLKIYGRNETSSMKTPWIILILTLPILGVALYFLIGLNGGTWKMRMRYKKIDEKLLPLLPENKEVLQCLNASDPKAGNVSNYIERNACYPVYQNTDVIYFDEAVKGLEAQLADLAKAEQFIFMEYHAIEDEYAWSRIQTVLEERVKAGVEVRVFYDDMGSIGFVNLSFARKLEAKGIACRVFNPLLPGLNMFLNNRDHRKITVVDGKVGYTGGYNLANEYFNYTHPYGEWKDTGIRLEGDAVASLTAAFLEMWESSGKTPAGSCNLLWISHITKLFIKSNCFGSGVDKDLFHTAFCKPIFCRRDRRCSIMLSTVFLKCCDSFNLSSILIQLMQSAGRYRMDSIQHQYVFIACLIFTEFHLQ